MGNETGSCTVTVSGGSGGFSYSWSSTVGGSFSAGNSANATFTAPVVSSTTTGSLICSVTDTCGRRNFISRPITISTQVLPIELKKLDAEYNGKGVDITWTTASEINNDYFSIEHSTDGIHYTDIGKVNGSGNSTSDISYKFTHESPSQSYNYYKLRQTDYDGTKETFGPVYVKINKLQNTFAITDVGPNPFNDRININYSLDKEGEASFTLVNATGAVVRTDKLQSGAGQSSYEFSGLESLPTGIYYAILTSGENKKVVKILKNR
jgi:hypothetical protein